MAKIINGDVEIYIKQLLTEELIGNAGGKSYPPEDIPIEAKSDARTLTRGDVNRTEGTSDE
jgi:hypothetical protein